MPRVLFLAAVITAGGLGLRAVAQQPATELAGVYACEGTNGDGSAYHGIVVISQHNDAYEVQWRFPGGTSAIGIGIRTGGTLAVTYFGSVPGVALYQVDGDRLVGRWTVVGGDGRVASETLVHVPGHAVPPSDDAPEVAPAPADHDRPTLPRIRV